MKKILFAIATVALLFATSCKNSNAPEDITMGEGEFLATIDNGANPQNATRVSDGMTTKTTIDANKYVIWESGDQISINCETYTTNTSGSTVKFTGGNATGTEYDAFFPATIAGTGAAGTLPAVQTYQTGKVSNLPMYAHSTTNQLKFHNICAALKITIPSFLNGADNIVISSDERMNGAFTIATEGDGFKAVVAAPTTDADKKVTISKSSGTFATNEVVYIAVPAQIYNNFKVEFFNGANSMWCKTLATCTLNVNTVNPINITPAALCFTARYGSVTVKFDIKNVTHQIQTSIDGGASWQNYTSGTGIKLEEDEKVYFQAAADQTTATAFGSAMEYSNFKFSTKFGEVEASGNIMSLYGPSCPNLPLPNYAFKQMFDGCFRLNTAPELPANTLGEHCYEKMFSGCVYLGTAPVLPAVTLQENCYSYMFQGCSYLRSVTMKATDVGATDCLLNWLYGAGTLADQRILYVDNSMTGNSTITDNKGNFTVQAYNPSPAP